MQETLAHHVKAIKHPTTAALKLDLKHLVHLDELFRLIVLNEFDEEELLVLNINHAVQVCFRRRLCSSSACGLPT